MYSYVFTNDYGLSPGDVETILASAGLTGATIQIWHYTRPRAVFIMMDRELQDSERQELLQAIANIHGIDPVVPGG